MADLYERGISTGSMSKAFSLAGLRLGWIAGPKDLIHAVSIHRDYNTISVGMLDDHFASIALEHRDAILARNRAIVRENLAILDRWVAEEPAISYVKPKGGTVALLKYDFDLPSRDFCVRLLEAEGVMFTPGSALDMEGYVRIGYANNRAVLEEGLPRVSRFLRTLNSTAVRAKMSDGHADRIMPYTRRMPLLRHPKAWPWDPRVCLRPCGLPHRNSWMVVPSTTMTNE